MRGHVGDINYTLKAKWKASYRRRRLWI
ncbi:unnamed protein product [Debaryomyces tyrocola]|nr:unnamed protein product [Debaryomyces tyrocola]